MTKDTTSVSPLSNPGYFEKGQRRGEGFFQYANKDRYSGNWKNNMKHGFGTYIINDSKIKVATPPLPLI